MLNYHELCDRLSLREVRGKTVEVYMEVIAAENAEEQQLESGARIEALSKLRLLAHDSDVDDAESLASMLRESLMKYQLSVVDFLGPRAAGEDAARNFRKVVPRPE